ncbi:P-loop containing nucleoside triphosphate hydrolase protein [Hypoxylon sp. NC0597]|nr:P-loop containing nucleoside triphosphate hydrolase protein [Hypoxylon sp. NC0597]
MDYYYDSHIGFIDEHPSAYDRADTPSDILPGTSPVMNPIQVPEDSQREGVSESAAKLYQYNGIDSLRWSRFADPQDEQKDLEAHASKFPIISRYHRTMNGWETYSITIQDQSMREILRYLLRGYGEFDPELQDWTFYPPFKPLFHRWGELNDRETVLRDVPCAENTLSTLIDVLAPVVASSLAKVAKSRETNKIRFQELSDIFAPGTLVITKFYGVDTVCRVVKAVFNMSKSPMDSNSWIFTVEYVDWSGEESGYRKTSLEVVEFSGVRRVTKLPTFPVSYLTEEAKTRESLIQRGRKLEQLRGYRLMACNGVKLCKDKYGELRQEVVIGRVCIDTYAYYRGRKEAKPKLRSLDSENDSVAGEAKEPEVGYRTEFSIAHNVDPRPKHPGERNENLRKLTEEELLMTTPWVHGFDLKAKSWGLFCVDDLHEVIWNDNAFDKLILPNSEKEIALAFVEGKRRSNDSSFDDFIQNKGRGLIILMFGPPGVGKTFTAEAVAERSKVALYAMSAGDLGTQPSEVEENLGRALELCSMWDAILLLDEADVFLAARTNNSPKRNEFVSIFLRMLEYYTGTLFLTTNRVESIDHAFQSRIDLFLPYNDLTKQARRHVWEGLLDRVEHSLDVTDEELDNLSEFHLNGREIKNVVKSAHILWLGSDDNQTSPSDRLYSLAKNRIQALEPLYE